MRSIPALGSPAPRGLFGVLRSWLQAGSSENAPSSEGLPSEIGVPYAPLPFPYSLGVLVVDDNPVNLMVISAQLELLGVVPLLAADGAEAVALASELHFDLILMDLQMPILDGLRATSAIRQCEAFSSRPAAPVLAYSNTSVAAGVLATHGINGSLSKPCGDQELEDCLARWCPTYRSAPPVRGVTHGHSGWQPASRNPGTASASLR